MLLLLLIVTSQLVTHGHGGCTPDLEKDLINSCLTENSLITYFQFPVVTAAKYTSLCYNTTCMTLCMQSAIQGCMSEAHAVYLGNGQSVKAAYLGFCHQSETNVTNALACGSTVDNQAALNIITTFQYQLQNYVDTRSENSTVICQDWLTMITGLTSLVTSACSGDAMAVLMWQSFMNTIHAACDASLTPSFYDDYRHTPVQQCNSANTVIIGHVLFTVSFIVSIVNGFLHFQ